jgi:hypothetical protein
MQEGIKGLEEEMSRVKATLDERSKEVEEARRAASKAAKALEQAEKEISSRVRCYSKRIAPLMIIVEIRMTKSRGWALSARAYTVNAASRRSNYRWSLEISRTFPWRRCVVARFCPAILSLFLKHLSAEST